VTESVPVVEAQAAASPEAEAVPPPPAANSTDGADLSQAAVMPGSPASFDAPERSWFTDDDPFAALGPADARDDEDLPPRNGMPPASSSAGHETA
jgi:hypothetical protein